MKTRYHFQGRVMNVRGVELYYWISDPIPSMGGQVESVICSVEYFWGKR